MINRKFNGPSGRATKFSHPRATMSIIVVMFIAEPLISLQPFAQSDCWTLGLQTTDANKTSEACGCSLLRPRRVDVTLGGAGGSRCARQRRAFLRGTMRRVRIAEATPRRAGRAGLSP